MVGLVVVSHSARLAEGVAELAAQMVGEVRIGVAGGLDQPGRPLGTDATLVLRAIEEVWSEDGVLVLMDLGSAVLSAEMAVDLLPEERRDRVLLTEAPLVEGAVAAAVVAGLGEPLEKVADEARSGLAAKVAHIGAEAGAATARMSDAGANVGAAGDAGASADQPAGTGPGIRLAVRNRLGLHARPAALLVRTAAGFDAKVTVANATTGRGPVTARSLNAVATLGVRQGNEILVRASGPQAGLVLAAVRRLADDAFGEADDVGRPSGAEEGAGGERTGPATTAAPAPSGTRPEDAEPGAPTVTAAPPAGDVLHGLSASPGIAVGAARHLRPAPIAISGEAAEDPATEWAELERALAATAVDARRAQALVAGRAGTREGAIFEAHLLFLEDPALLDPTRLRVFSEHVPAARAWADAVAAAATAWDALDDPYQRARAADLRSVGDQVLRHLLGTPVHAAPGGSGIVVAPDLTPAEAAALDRESVLGVACAFGGPTAHSAILARSLGIPAVVDLGPELLAVAEGALLAIDGAAGTVTVEPPPDTVAAARRGQAEWEKHASEALRSALLPAVTRDGATVSVAANSAGPGDVPAAVAAGADGVGLLRTEFLFLESDHLPTEDEQERAYREAAVALGGRRLTIRTLDAGADKPLASLPLAPEANPYLGVRGLRLGLARPGLLLTQLRAVLRVAADHPVRVMFPMVATVDELRRARGLLDNARTSLAASGSQGPTSLEVGIMVEIPAAALLAEAFAPHLDFFSIGTNDLTQYALAAERGNAGVAALADPLHPAVLRLIERTAMAAAAAGRRVAVCGEVAGDPLAIPLLLGLGVVELSMASARIPLAKEAVRKTDLGTARALAEKALAAESAADVRGLCGNSVAG